MRRLTEALSLGLVVLCGEALTAEQAHAQTRETGEPPILARDAVQTGSAFQLFGAVDFASVGLRLAGRWRGCADNSSNIVTEWQCWDNLVPGSRSNTPNWFDIFFYWAVPSSEREKHAEIVPSLLNAAGKGYTVNSAIGQYAGKLLPHDGTLGPYHSGAISRRDGSCLDFTASQIGSGQPLLAASDCEPTWGSLGWQGSQLVDAEGFLAFADRVGDLNFSFDPYSVPPEYWRRDTFLGDFQSYGFFSDYSIETLFGTAGVPSYGNVIPEWVGGDDVEQPGRTGWPLGLLAKMDGFSFTGFGLQNTGWFQITVTNNSREVYGVGLDYDSLYMGILPGWLTFEGGTSLYRDPANGVTRGATFCQTIGCGPGGDPMHPGDQWGAIQPNGVGEGFNYGAAAIVVLKSPIGDLRNKLFTDPRSGFFQMGDPSTWDDTITFNHGHMCGFHGCSAVTFYGSVGRPPLANTDYEQRQFGLVASITSDVLGDREMWSMTDHTAWDTWRWEEYPDRNQLDFNKWMPGDWDYDEDGSPDTLFFDDCSDNAGLQFDPVTGNQKRCSVSWSDTLTSGTGNLYPNQGAVTGAGPFRLPADSTVQWVIALVHANDSTNIDNDIAAAVRHYMTFYRRPENAPAPVITSVEVETNSDPRRTPSQPEGWVTLYYDATTEDWADPFLQTTVDLLVNADPRTELGKLRLLNPFLETTLRILIHDNVAAIHVFKSCDGGLTFTSDDDCFPDAPNAGEFMGLGWFPWRTLEPDASGDFPNVVTDDGVRVGRTFLYSLVTETRGSTVPVLIGEPQEFVNGSDTTYVCVSNCRTENLTIAPKLISPLLTVTDEPNVVSVYAPVSQQSGHVAATVELRQASPDFIPFERMNVSPTSTDVLDGEYRLLFGESAIVTEDAIVEPQATTVTQTVVQLIRDTTDTLRLTADGEVAVEGEFTQMEDSIGGELRRLRVWRLPDTSAVLTDASDVPITVTDDLVGGQTVPGRYFGLSNFPGFTMSIDNTVGAQFERQDYFQESGDLVPPLIVPSISLLNAADHLVEGRYRITWADRAFGEDSPFPLRFTDPETTRETVVESLRNRTAGQMTAGDPDLAGWLGLTPEEFATAYVPLVRLPFTIENVIDAANPAPVSVLIRREGKQTSLTLGSGVDTMIVQVPQTEWVPGDELMLIDGDFPDYQVTFAAASVGCEPNQWLRESCNPVALRSPGATGYVETSAGQELRISYYQRITSDTRYAFAVRSAVRGSAIHSEPSRIRAALDSVRVVPNPFALFSRYSTANSDYVLFTHVPPRGIIRMFTVSGQFVQELRWEPWNLNGQGDLRFNLRTREDLLMGAGLYLYVVTALDDQGREVGTTKGKFVVIR